MKQENVIVKKSFDLSVSVISISEKIKSRYEFVLGDQFLKSGTSIGANIRESQYAESKADFIHKLKIAAKEANEHNYWLELLVRTAKIEKKQYKEHKELLDSVTNILNKIILTTKKNIIRNS